MAKNQKIGMSQTLTNPVCRQEAEARAGRSAEEQRDRDRRHRDEVHELGEEEDREPDAGVLGVEAADELLLGFDEVERRVVGLRDRRDDEDDEGQDRGPEVPVREERLPVRPRLAVHDAAGGEGAGVQQHADDGEPERGLVATGAARTRARSRATGTSTRSTSPRASRRRARCRTSRAGRARRSGGPRAAGTSGARRWRPRPRWG